MKWIEEWLTGRQQRVVINGQSSDWEDITSGVVQGSVLGPCLFLIYINDIDGGVENLGGFLSKFADDTKWAMVVETEEDRGVFQQGLNALVEGSEEWQLLFNVSKCKIMHVGAGNPKYTYEMGEKELEEVEV